MWYGYLSVGKSYQSAGLEGLYCLWQHKGGGTSLDHGDRIQSNGSSTLPEQEECQMVLVQLAKQGLAQDRSRTARADLRRLIPLVGVLVCLGLIRC